MFQLGFPTRRDSATFRDKGTTGQAKNLAKGRDGPGQPKFGTGRAGTAKIRDGTGYPKTGTGHGTKRDRAEKDVLKQENDVLKQKMMFCNRKECSKTGK